MAGEQPGRAGILPEPQTQFAERGVEPRLDRQRGHGAFHLRLGVPNHVENDVLVSGIAVVAMAAPTGRVQINLDITAARGAVAELQNGLAEVRTGFVVPEAGMKNADPVSVQGLQAVALQSLVQPDLLHQPFRRGRFARFAQGQRCRRLGAPFGVKLGRNTGHLAIAFRLRLLQSQARRARRTAGGVVPPAL